MRALRLQPSTAPAVSLKHLVIYVKGKHISTQFWPPQWVLRLGGCRAAVPSFLATGTGLMEDNCSPWTRAVGLRGWGGKQDGSSGNASDGERWRGAEGALISSPTTHPLWWAS